VEEVFFVKIKNSEWGALFSVEGGDKVSHSDYLIFLGSIPEVIAETQQLLRRDNFALFFSFSSAAVVEATLKDASPRGIPVTFQIYL